MRFALFRRRRDGDEDMRMPWRARLVVGWAGMRGVVTLATFLLIPDNPATPESAGADLRAPVDTAGTCCSRAYPAPALPPAAGYGARTPVGRVARRGC